MVVISESSRGEEWKGMQELSRALGARGGHAARAGVEDSEKMVGVRIGPRALDLRGLEASMGKLAEASLVNCGLRRVCKRKAMRADVCDRKAVCRLVLMWVGVPESADDHLDGRQSANAQRRLVCGAGPFGAVAAA